MVSHDLRRYKYVMMIQTSVVYMTSSTWHTYFNLKSFAYLFSEPCQLNFLLETIIDAEKYVT